MQTNYESIAYNKDFLTGTTKETTKTKRDKGIKGKVTLSLFDAKTGEKVKEAYTENLIPDLYFKDCFLGQFLNGVMGAGNLRYTNTYSWFNFLYLTDSDKPENANEQRVEGNIIGYADRNSPYSGDDPQRGTINRAETKFSVSGNKIKLNFVFDFPTHAANGITESVYFCEANPEYKDYFYIGAPVFAREGGDNDYTIDSVINPRRYYGVYFGFNYDIAEKFLSHTQGVLLLDGKSTSLTQSQYLQFPESLRGHMIAMPFDINVNDCMLWEQAVKLLNSNGDPLASVSGDAIKVNDGIDNFCPFTNETNTKVYIGIHTFSTYVQGVDCKILRIYKWSKVGVFQSYVDVNLTLILTDTAKNKFICTQIRCDSTFYDGTIDVIGYNQCKDATTKEDKYTSRWARINTSGEIVQNMEIKPKIGNSTWFGTKGMDSGNIDRRCYVYDMRRTKSHIYLLYNSVQGGSSFWQVLNIGGNLVEPFRRYFGVSDSYYSFYNILGTDKFGAEYGRSSSGGYSFMTVNALTSRPIGTHTRLAQAVEKTEANTMKVQYLFEVDLPIYGEDYY